MDDSECPLCAMVKAGPCRELFFPFEACLEKCDTDGKDPVEGCRKQFMEMMQCINRFPEEYKRIEAEMKQKKPPAPDDSADGELEKKTEGM